MPNYGWRKQSKCIFDSDIRLDIRRSRDIRVRDIEIRLYSTKCQLEFNNTRVQSRRLEVWVHQRSVWALHVLVAKLESIMICPKHKLLESGYHEWCVIEVATFSLNSNDRIFIAEKYYLKLYFILCTYISHHNLCNGERPKTVYSVKECMSKAR